MAPKYYSEKRFYNFREIINYSADRFAKRTAFEVKVADDKYKNIKIVEVLSSALEKTTTQKIKRFGKNIK